MIFSCHCESVSKIRRGEKQSSKYEDSFLFPGSPRHFTPLDGRKKILRKVQSLSRAKRRNDRARWVILPLHFSWDWLYFSVLHCNTLLCPQYLSKRKKQIQSLSPSGQREVSMRHFAIRHTETDWIRVSSLDSLSDHTMTVISAYDSENQSSIGSSKMRVSVTHSHASHPLSIAPYETHNHGNIPKRSRENRIDRSFYDRERIEKIPKWTQKLHRALYFRRWKSAQVILSLEKSPRMSLVSRI